MAETPLALFANLRLTERLLPHVAARLFNEPLAIEPGKLQTILGAIGPRLGLHGPQTALPATAIRQDRRRDYQMLDGVAVVPMLGTIVKRNEGGMLADSGLVSLEALRETIATALGDPAVRAVLLQVDSYGGEAIGTADLARFIYAARGAKPIWAVADDAAYSAAYYLAAAADRVFVSQAGGLGSIGVIALHVDQSAALAAEGTVVTPIFAGEEKLDGADFLPLSERARARMQARVNQVWDLFIADVAAFRRMDPATVRGFQAGTVYGRAAVAAGLADGVATFDDVLTELGTLSAGGVRRGGTMAKDVGPAAPEAKPAEVVSLEDVRKERQAGEAAGTERERKRVKGIRELAQLSRLPVAQATALADQLVDEGTDGEEARTRFLKAQATAQSAVEMRPALAPDGEGLPQKPARRPAHEVYTEREQVLAQARRW